MNNKFFQKNKKNEGIEPNINFSNKRFEQIDIDAYYHLYLKESLISNESYDNKTNFHFIQILIYNKKDVLVKSIRSINNQSLKNIEIIILNNNSIDKGEVIFQ